MQACEIASLKLQLCALRNELESHNSLAENSSQPVAGRVSRGDALQQQEMAKAGIARNKQRLIRVNAALQRIENDDYGFCLQCGEDIPTARLEIMPDAELCIPCREQHE